jgi:Flavin containing amine oxidoreductase
MLIALMAGTAAYSVEETDNESLIAEVTDRLAKVFAPAEIPRPSEVIVTRWKKDPFARGSYSFVGPQTQTGDYDVMAQRVGPIHFAGEATCGTHPATVHGAYLSGLRAASEVIDSLLGSIKIPSLTAGTGSHKVKIEQIAPEDSPTATGASASDTNTVFHSNLTRGTIVSGTKRKRGYVDVWEPVLPPPDPNAETRLRAEAEDYEALIIGAILSTLSDRPIKPEKPIVNPYLLYQNDEWYNVKARCDATKAATTGDPNAKTSRNDIRIALGADWRHLPESLKKPYIDKSQMARDTSFEAVANYNEAVKKWDREAERVRQEFIAANPPSVGVMQRLEGRTAIEFGGDRKGRKMGGYAE